MIVSMMSFSLILTICIFSSSSSASGIVGESTSSRPFQGMGWQKSSLSMNTSTWMWLVGLLKIRRPPSAWKALISRSSS